MAWRAGIARRSYAVGIAHRSYTGYIYAGFYSYAAKQLVLLSEKILISRHCPRDLYGKDLYKS